MGHRALVAYERADGRYDCRYSHWGGLDLSLARRIGPRTPLGGGADGGSFGRRALWALDLVEASVGSARATEVDPEPVATGLDLDEVVAECLDFRVHEAVYLVSPEYDATAYRVLRFDLPGGDPAFGALVEVDPPAPAEDGYVRGWFDGLVRGVHLAHDRGDLDDRRAAEVAERELRAFASDRGREVLIAPRG